MTYFYAPYVPIVRTEVMFVPYKLQNGKTAFVSRKWRRIYVESECIGKITAFATTVDTEVVRRYVGVFPSRIEL